TTTDKSSATAPTPPARTTHSSSTTTSPLGQLRTDNETYKAAEPVGCRTASPVYCRSEAYPGLCVVVVGSGAVGGGGDGGGAGECLRDSDCFFAGGACAVDGHASDGAC